MKTTLLSFFGIACTLAASAQNLPYNTGFDNTSEQAGWTYYQEGDAGSSEWTMTGGGSSAPNALHHDYNVGAPQTAEVIDWMVSPALNFSGPVNITLLASESGFSTPTDDNCLVYVGTGNQDPTMGNFTVIGNLSSISPQGTWIENTFTTSITGTCYLAFRYKTIGAAWCTYSIDDIEITLQNPDQVELTSTIQERLRISPNPANDFTRIAVPLDGSSTIQLISTTGQPITELQIYGGTQGILDLTSFNSGVYIVRWKNQKGIVQSERLIIQ